MDDRVVKFVDSFGKDKGINTAVSNSQEENSCGLSLLLSWLFFGSGMCSLLLLLRFLKRGWEHALVGEQHSSRKLQHSIGLKHLLARRYCTEL